MEPFLEKKYSICLYYSSHLFLITFLYALHIKKYQLSIVPGSVFLTSINHWKHPTYSFRRNLDLVVVNTSIVYQNYMAYNAKYAKLYYVIFLIGTFSYPISIYFHNKKYYWFSTFSHMSIHILSFANSFILYSD